VITPQTAQAWAARLENVEKLDPLEASSAPQFINKFIKPLGVEIRYIGEETHTHCMIVTQRADFKGRVGMPSSEIPQFVEGEQETLARNILIEHGVWFRSLLVSENADLIFSFLGVQDFKFETWLD